jgi:hypothetical protein
VQRQLLRVEEVNRLLKLRRCLVYNLRIMAKAELRLSGYGERGDDRGTTDVVKITEYDLDTCIGCQMSANVQMLILCQRRSGYRDLQSGRVKREVEWREILGQANCNPEVVVIDQRN